MRSGPLVRRSQSPPTGPAASTSAKLTAEREELQSYVVFVVRDDRKADFLFQVSDTTWNAYNRWPSQYSLYDDGKKVWYWGPNVQTSFDRPYGKYCQILDAPLSVGSGEFLLWEFPLAYWMEQHGYDVSYISNLDTHADPAGLRRAKGWLSVGHDEYWSLSMFETMKRMVSEGMNLAFLSGNSICGVIDINPSSDGRPGRMIERVGRFGSPRKEELENGFPEEALFTRNGPNEATLMGARSTYPTTGGGDWICRKPDHWLFAGTGMKAGDGIPGLVGWEWHGEPAAIPGLEIVASGKTTSPRAEGPYTATIYPGPKGNFVFNAATIWWADGLSQPPGYVRPAVYTRPQGPDPRVQRITRTCSSGCEQSNDYFLPKSSSSEIGSPPAMVREPGRSAGAIDSLIHRVRPSATPTLAPAWCLLNHRLTANTIHPPARKPWANHGLSIDAAETSSRGNTSRILKPARLSSRFSSAQR